MAKTFQVDVVSPEATVWSGRALIVIARTPEGELGIMADHEPLMATCATGPIEIEAESGERTTIGVHGGFLQVLDNQVTLEVESVGMFASMFFPVIANAIGSGLPHTVDAFAAGFD